MKTPAVLKTQEGQWAIIAIAGLAVLYLVSKGLLKFGKAAATAAAGLVTGNNALTAGTAYQGAGLFGTLGAAANAASGGTLQSLGSSIGNTLYDWLNPNGQAATRDQVVTPNYVNDLSTLTGGAASANDAQAFDLNAASGNDWSGSSSGGSSDFGTTSDNTWN